MHLSYVTSLHMVVEQEPRSVSPKRLVLSPERKLSQEAKTSVPFDEKSQFSLGEDSTADDYYQINIVSPPNSPPREMKARMARDREVDTYLKLNIQENDSFLMRFWISICCKIDNLHSIGSS